MSNESSFDEPSPLSNNPHPRQAMWQSQPKVSNVEKFGEAIEMSEVKVNVEETQQPPAKAQVTLDIKVVEDPNPELVKPPVKEEIVTIQIDQPVVKIPEGFEPVDEAEIQRILREEQPVGGPDKPDNVKSPVSQQMNQFTAQKITYKALRSHIDHNHPTKLDENLGKQVPFLISDRLGRLPLFHCFERFWPSKISPMARQIGVGPSLFLMSTKALAVLFLILSLVNIPVLIEFQRGTRIEREIHREEPLVSDFFSMLSLGNIGKAEQACATTRSLTSSEVLDIFSGHNPSYEIDLTCYDEKTLGEISQLYLISGDQANCSTAKTDPKLFNTGVLKDDPSTWKNCLQGSTWQKSFFNKDLKSFDACAGQNKCRVSPLPYIRAILDDFCDAHEIEALLARRNYRVFIQAECGKNLDDYTWMGLIFFFDVLTIGILAIFTIWLQGSQEEYTRQFATQTLEMNDFAIRVKPIPHQSQYDRNDEVLRANLIHHFQTISKIEFLKKRMREERAPSESAMEQIVREESARNGVPLPWEVADVSFGKRNMGEVLYLLRLSEIRNKSAKAQLKMQKMNGMLDKLKLQVLKQTYAKMFEQERDRYWKKKAEMEQESVNPEIRYAYVVFRNMEATDLVLQAYNVGFFKQRLLTSFLGKLCFKKQRERYEQGFHYGQRPVLNRACQPEFIKPENLGYSSKERRLRSLATWLVAIILICLSTAAILFLKDVIVDIQDDFPSGRECSPVPTAEQALVDHTRAREDKLGYMHCFCINQLLKERSLSFKFDDENPGSLYCKDWAKNYLKVNFISHGTSAALAAINIIMCIIFEKMASFEKSHTTTEESLSQFNKISALQYINISIVLLLVNFSFFTDTSFDFLPIFQGKYDDFNEQWYAQVGKTLCVTLAIQIVAPHVSKLIGPAIQLFKRFKDRGYTQRLKIKDEDAEIDVNTQLLLQEEVNELYTGGQVSIQYIYAQNFTYLWCALTFSTGMPFLYLLGFLYFTVFYWVYKYLLLRFYVRSTLFNEFLPLKSVKLILLGMVLHVVFGGQMMTYLTFESSPVWEGDVISNIMDRIMGNYMGFMYTVFLLICIGVWKTKTKIADNLAKVSSIFSCCCPRRGPSQKVREFSEDIFRELQLSFLESMYVKASIEHDRYRAYLQEKQLDPKGQKEAAHIEYLEKRIRDIEGVADDHVRALHGPEGPALLQRLGYRGKMRYLLAKKDKIPRDGTRLRMEGLTQSYDVFESVLYKKAQAVKEILQDNPSYSI